jgi:hypothetical protein
MDPQTTIKMSFYGKITAKLSECWLLRPMEKRTLFSVSQRPQLRYLRGRMSLRALIPGFIKF